MEVERLTAFCAGDWLVDPEINALARDGVVRHVEPKVMSVLLVLALRQSHVYSKEEIIAAVWPDTFVSDDALTRCISILRRITEDNPHAPRFIQTVPKRGYRLIAPISELPVEASAAKLPLNSSLHLQPGQPGEAGTAPVVTVLAPASLAAKVPGLAAPGLAVHSPAVPGPAVLGPVLLHAVQSPPSAASRIPSILSSNGWRAVLFAVMVLAISMAALAGWMWLGGGQHSARPEDFRTISFTSGAGNQTEAAFSPAGGVVAYVRTSDGGGTRRIMLKRIGTEETTELTHDLDEQFSPAWSPDGKQLAYLARSAAGLGLFVADVSGKVAPRRVFIPQQPSHWEQGALSWSPDGRSLVFPDHPGTSASSSIFRLALDTLRLEPVTTPPPGWEGDLNPEYSPDGKKLAFTRASETAVRDIYWISLADGALHQLTQDRKDTNSLAWRNDSRSIVFSSDRGGKYSLWEIGLDQKEPQRLPVGTDDAFGPAVGPKAGELAYSQGTALWSIDQLSGEGATATLKTITASTEQDSAPSLSPDGKAFVFQSQRSGNQEIWLASADGTKLRQLTFNNGPITGSPSWSHHGNEIVFDSRVDGHSHIFAIPAAGGKPRQITFGSVNDIIPRWSNDDRTIYFRSNRGGRWQIWRAAVDGGEPQPVSSGDGMAPEESADGTSLYYTRAGEAGLWRVAVSGGVETQVLQQPAEGYWGYFQVLAGGVVYLDTSRTPATLRKYVPATGGDTLFATLERTPPAFQGLSSSSTGRLVLMTGERDAGQHITLVESK